MRKNLEFLFWLFYIFWCVPSTVVVFYETYKIYNFWRYAPYYELYYTNQISEIDGDWEYAPSLKIMDYFLWRPYQKERTFSCENAWDYVNQLPCRIRIKNNIFQSYGFFNNNKRTPLNYVKSEESGLYHISEKTKLRLVETIKNLDIIVNFTDLRNDENIDRDLSEMFEYYPLKFYEDPENFEANKGANAIMLDEKYLEKYYDPSQSISGLSNIELIKKSSSNAKDLFALICGGRCPQGSKNWYWYMSLKNIGTRPPSADLPIVFYDELNVLDAEEVAKIEVLSIADENLSELPEKLRECKNLKKLFMPYNKLRFTSRDMEILTSFKELEILDIRYNDIANSSDPNLTELKKLTKLRRAYIAGKNFGKDNYVPTVFAEIPSLELLSISYAKDVKFSPSFRASKTPTYINLTYVELNVAEGKNLLIEHPIFKEVSGNCFH